MSLGTSDKDLDLFLAGVEGKLRGPFTPLELTKVLTTPALRNDLSISTYCDNLAAVFSRTDKVIQMRILLALAGLLLQNEKIADEADAIRTTIFEILHDAQSSGGQEEWVRMISGLIERILESRDDDDDEEEEEEEKDESSPASSPVATMLQTACKDILESVQTLCEETTADENNSHELPEDDEHVLHLTQADVDPTLAPFRYSLLKPAILDHMAPEVAAQTHFKIDTAASILQEDARLERTKAIEEAEHNHNVMGRGTKALASGGGGAANNKVMTPGPIMPGVQTTKKPTANGKLSAKPKPKSSLFVNTKKPIPSAGGTGLRMKTGATSRLLGKGRTIQPNATTGAGIKPKTSLLTGIAGRAKLQNNKASKMKMMDVSEVNDLAKEKEQATSVAPAKPGLALKKGLKKRKLNDTAPSSLKLTKLAKAPPTTVDGHTAAAPAPTAAAPASPASPAPKAAVAAPASPPAQNQALAAGALAAAALSNYQKQIAAAPKPSSPSRAVAPPAPAAPQQLDWRSLLATKSNKLTPDDRRRIQLFFEARQNPTPAQSTYRVKLHEERIEDNGEIVKWTYYLNLNYSDWTSTQSKKRKKY